MVEAIFKNLTLKQNQRADLKSYINLKFDFCKD